MDSKNICNTKRTYQWLLLFTMALMILGSSCKKIIEQKEKNIIIDAITNGHWYVEQYKQDSTDLTSGFAAWEFQFYENGNVEAIKNAVVNSSGTWSSDITNYTITANFPVTASDTLKLLNHTWKITDSYLNYVEANTSTATGSNILHLRKK